MFDTKIFENKFPNLPFILYPKGYSELIESDAFVGLGSPNLIKSNVAEIIIDGLSKYKDETIPSFYYIPSIEKVTVVLDNFKENTSKTEVYDVKSNPSKFIWDYLKNTKYFYEVISILSRLDFKLNLDDVTKSTKFSDIYKKLPYSQFKLMKLYDYKWSKTDTLGGQIGYDAYEHIISKIPKNIRDEACNFQRVGKDSDLSFYVSSLEFGYKSYIFFIALPVSKGYLFPLVLNLYNSTNFKVDTLVGTTYRSFSNGCVPKGIVEESLMELGYKSNEEFLKNILKIAENAISKSR